MAYDIAKIREALKKKLSSRKADPHQFQAPKAGKDDELKFRYFVLPGLMAGDPCYGGVASRDMDPYFFVKYGLHWVNNRPHTCPRITDEAECEMCQVGFDLLADMPKDQSEENKEKRRQVSKVWLAQQCWAINIYFPPFETTPEPLRGKVMWTNSPQTCFNQYDAAINRDNGGDIADPVAFGIFYDPEAAYLYQLTVIKDGSNNGYKGSRFLANLGPQPIVMGKDGKPDKAGIKKVLDLRHDLYTKIDPANPAEIHRLTQMMLNGVDSITPEEVSTSASVPATPPPAQKQQAKPAQAAQAAHVAPTQALDEEVAAAPPPTAPKTKPAAAATTKPVAAATTAKPKQAAKPAPAPEPEEVEEAAPAAAEDDEQIQDLLRQLQAQ